MKPNFDDLRVVKRSLWILAWADVTLNALRPKQIHHDKLASVFGGRGKVATYLRDQLLIRHGYYKPGVHAYGYTLNIEGKTALEHALSTSVHAQLVNTIKQEAKLATVSDDLLDQ